VIVHDLDGLRPRVDPAEAHPGLIVHADAVLAGPIARQRFQPVAGRNPEIVESSRPWLSIASLRMATVCTFANRATRLPPYIASVSLQRNDRIAADTNAMRY